MKNNPNLIVLTLTQVKHIQNMTLPSLSSKFCFLWHMQPIQSLFPRYRCARVCADVCERVCALILEGRGISFLKPDKNLNKQNMLTC